MIHTLAKEKSTTKTEALTIFKKGLFYTKHDNRMIGQDLTYQLT